jgi:hypothetical protein
MPGDRATTSEKDLGRSPLEGGMPFWLVLSTIEGDLPGTDLVLWPLLSNI